MSDSMTGVEWMEMERVRGNAHDKTTKAGRATMARIRRRAAWEEKWEHWKAVMRGKYGADWAPIAGCDTWRKWRGRRLLRLSVGCVEARKRRDAQDREFLRRS